MTADLGNLVAKTDEKRKTKDEMKQTLVHILDVDVVHTLLIKHDSLHLSH